MANMALMRQKQVSSHVRKLSLTLERGEGDTRQALPQLIKVIYVKYILKYRVNNSFFFLKNTVDKIEESLTKQREKQRNKLKA